MKIYNQLRIKNSLKYANCSFMNLNSKKFSMNLHEYQAQGLLKKYNVPIPNVIIKPSISKNI